MTLILLSIFFETFMILILAMILDSMGVGYMYYDELIISFVFVMFMPAGYLALFENDL